LFFSSRAAALARASSRWLPRVISGGSVRGGERGHAEGARGTRVKLPPPDSIVRGGCAAARITAANCPQRRPLATAHRTTASPLATASAFTAILTGGGCYARWRPAASSLTWQSPPVVARTYLSLVSRQCSQHAGRRNRWCRGTKNPPAVDWRG
jgi:hypothetical protein